LFGQLPPPGEPGGWSRAARMASRMPSSRSAASMARAGSAGGAPGSGMRQVSSSAAMCQSIKVARLFHAEQIAVTTGGPGAAERVSGELTGSGLGKLDVVAAGGEQVGDICHR